MSTLTAIAHLTGVIVVWGFFFILMLVFDNWTNARNAKEANAEIALELNIAPDQLDYNDLTQARRILPLLNQRFSRELLGNRVSDLWGSIMGALLWGVFLLEIGIIFGAAWATFYDNRAAARYAWLAVIVQILAAIADFVASYLCFLLTGRYPRQARQMREVLTKYASSVLAAVPPGSEKE